MDGSDEPPGMGKSLGSCSRATVDTLGPPMQSSSKDPCRPCVPPMCSKAKIPSSTLPSTAPLKPASAQMTALVQETGASDAVENGAKCVIMPPP